MTRGFHLVLLTSLVLACGAPAQRAPAAVTRERGEPLTFAFGTIDGSVVTGENTRGRVTVLLFVTTFDLSSQAAARRLAEVQRRHVPKINAAAIVLEAAENAVLVDVFRKSLGLPYPVAIADSVELRASEAFAGIDRVPTVVVLDRSGALVRRYAGLFEAADLESWLREAQR